MNRKQATGRQTQKQVVWRVPVGRGQAYPLDRRYPLAPAEGEVIDGEWRYAGEASERRVGVIVGLLVVFAIALVIGGVWLLLRTMPWIVLGVVALPGAILVIAATVFVVVKVIIGPPPRRGCRIVWE